MRALVIGGGSIGSRHLRNLKNLGISDLILVEPNVNRRDALCQEMELEGLDRLERAWDWRPDFAIVASPTNLHVKQALEAVRAGCHVLIEKPLSHTNAGLAELLREIDERGLVSLVGCNMRFRPGPIKVKKLLDAGVIGKVLFGHLHVGFYLPKWRPWQDYRESYSANAMMGGGCLLDCIHEIDLARWYIGEIEEVFCLTGHLSSLEIDVEDVAMLICRHANGTLSEIQVDYVQQTYERNCQIVGERGSLYWDQDEERVRWFDGGRDLWEEFPQSLDWPMNQMYINELEHFLDCVRTGRQTTLPVSDAIEIMRVIFAARISAASGCLVHVEEVII